MVSNFASQTVWDFIVFLLQLKSSNRESEGREQVGFQWLPFSSSSFYVLHVLGFHVDFVSSRVPLLKPVWNLWEWGPARLSNLFRQSWIGKQHSLGIAWGSNLQRMLNTSLEVWEDAVNCVYLTSALCVGLKGIQRWASWVCGMTTSGGTCEAT